MNNNDHFYDEYQEIKTQMIKYYEECKGDVNLINADKLTYFRDLVKDLDVRINKTSVTTEEKRLFMDEISKLGKLLDELIEMLNNEEEDEEINKNNDYHFYDEFREIKTQIVKYTNEECKGDVDLYNIDKLIYFSAWLKDLTIRIQKTSDLTDGQLSLIYTICEVDTELYELIEMLDNDEKKKTRK